MVVVCCVPGCRNYNTTALKKNKTTFHRFAKSTDLQALWVTAIAKGTNRQRKVPLVPGKISPNTRVCSEHFLEKDFKWLSSTHRRLKEDAIPTCFAAYNNDGNNNDINNMNNDNNKKNQEPPVTLLTDAKDLKWKSTGNTYNTNVQTQSVCWDSLNSNTTIIDASNLTKKNYSENPKAADMNIYQKMYDDLLIKYNKQHDEKEKLLEEIATLKSEREMNIMAPSRCYVFAFSIDHFKSNDKDILYYTGFGSYKLLHISLKLLFGRQINHSPSKTFTNRQYKTKLNIENQYFLTLIKLRHDFGYKHLATLFNVSESTACNTFITWINFMYVTFGRLDIWPPRQILQDNSLANTEVYSNVIGCMDATEIFIQTPSSLVKQSQTYSHYKGCNTVKGLLVSDLNGAIIFISSLYTGSISDNNLVQKSGLINIFQHKMESNYLLPGDIFLADKGFTIQQLLAPLDLKLNIPVFRIEGTQFSAAEVEHTRVIAHERIHIERAIGRLKTYKILTHKVPIAQMGTFNQIWTVCCFLSNFKLPLRKIK